MTVKLIWDAAAKAWYSKCEPGKPFFGVYDSDLRGTSFIEGKYHITWIPDFPSGPCNGSIFVNSWDEVLTFCELIEE